MNEFRTHDAGSAIDDELDVERFDGPYRVMLDSPRRPRARQGTHDRAEREAARLAAGSPGARFIILQEVGAVTSPAAKPACPAGRHAPPVSAGNAASGYPPGPRRQIHHAAEGPRNDRPQQ